MISAVALLDAVRRPRRPALDIGLFFGVIAVVVTVRALANLTGSTDAEIRIFLYSGVVMVPYLLLRIVDDFVAQPRWLMGSTLLALPILIGALVLSGETELLPPGIAAIWFLWLGGYTALVFRRGSQTARGVTARRLGAAAIGSGLVGVILVLAILLVGFPQAAEPLAMLIELLALTTGVAWFAAFAPPPFLRRIWQEPEFRAFLSQSSLLATETDERRMLPALERLAADAIGAPAAVIGLLTEDGRRMRYLREDGRQLVTAPHRFITGQAFSRRRALFTVDAARDDPAGAEVYRTLKVIGALAAPIGSGGRPIGVLGIHAPRAPLFVRDDLVLTQLIADQIGVVLETRRLLLEAARLEARDEAARAKEDFLSAAAHDLRTPLSSLLLHADLLRRQFRRAGQAPEAERAERVFEDAQRASALVTDLLDAAREERVSVSLERQPVDLVTVAGEVARRYAADRHRVRVEATEAVVTHGDPRRISQLFDNLVGNAVKYSPGGGEVRVRVWKDGTRVRGAISDRGIGVPAADLPRLFQRFSRGGNVDDRHFKGIGLGLYICRRIVEEHGGRIWAESEVGRGTTVSFELPISPQQSDSPG